MVLVDIPWHLRAWRSQARWARTRAAIGDWLAQAPGGFDELLLFGASAGWMMPDEFLARFSRIDAIDFEWAASPLFRLRHAGVIRRGRIEVAFHRGEALGALEQWLALRPRALVVFDNVLGQYTLTCRDVARAEATLSGLAKRLRGRAWGSVHDALSGPGARLALADEPGCHALAAGSPWPEQELLRQVGGFGDWRDHLTRAVLPEDRDCLLVPWQLTPGYWHWLQAGWVA